MSKIRKLMEILFIVLFVVTVTAGAMSAAKNAPIATKSTYKAIGTVAVMPEDWWKLTASRGQISDSLLKIPVIAAIPTAVLAVGYDDSQKRSKFQ